MAEAFTAGLCREHVSADGPLIESFASAKSVQPKGTKDDDSGDASGFQPRNVGVDFHGQKRINETHARRTDPEAKRYRKGKGQEAKLAHRGHTLAENRHGLIVTITVTEANGTAERRAALDMRDEVQTNWRVGSESCGGSVGTEAVARNRRRVQPATVDEAKTRVSGRQDERSMGRPAQTSRVQSINKPLQTNKPKGQHRFSAAC